jgi:DNA-binding response OmpR family regulator
LKIILFTENVLVEEKLQVSLQHLGHELFVTKSLTDRIDELDAFNFELCIISNTVLRKKAEKIANKFSKRKIHVGFKGNDSDEAVTDENLDSKSKPIILLENDSMERLNEKISLFVENNLDTSLEISERNKLSKNERKVLTLLASDMETPYSREKICFHIWNEKSSKSNLSQLSSIVRRINQKLSTDNENTLMISTLWGKGYFCTKLD